MNILLSIKPKWAEKIYSGEKTVEWRKSLPCRIPGPELNHGDEKIKVYLYETHPVKKVTGFFEFGGVKVLDARFMDKDPKGCVPIEDLKKYQGDNCNLCAWIVKNPRRFVVPVLLEDFSLERPPQTWQYI